jgi:hypothetical protein
MVKKIFDTCTIEGCDGQHVALGYCDAHYRKASKYGDPLHSVHRSTCAIDGCVGKHQARGYCRRHYKKLVKYGDPLHQKHADHGTPVAFLRDLIGHDSDSCILWPFSRYANGYGSVWFEKALTGAHRLMCRLAHGEPSAAGLQAAHSCGRQLCVNPQHLRWATQAENEEDKILHGTAPRRRSASALEGAH